jgi:hypothetical protein
MTECTCYIVGFKDKRHSHTTRRFKPGCPTHDKSRIFEEITQ